MLFKATIFKDSTVTTTATQYQMNRSAKTLIIYKSILRLYSVYKSYQIKIDQNTRNNQNPHNGGKT